jgi:hypothetical protein
VLIRTKNLDLIPKPAKPRGSLAKIWNFKKLIKNKNQLILDRLSEIDADILILTETNSIIYPRGGYSRIAAESLTR